MTAGVTDAEARVGFDTSLGGDLDGGEGRLYFIPCILTNGRHLLWMLSATVPLRMLE